MATAFYSQNSSVEDFLKAHRTKLDRDKIRLKDNERSGVLPGLVSSNGSREGDGQRYWRSDYNQSLKDIVKDTHEDITGSRGRRSEYRPESIKEIRRKMQQEREEELGVDDISTRDGKKEVDHRRGALNKETPTSDIFGGLGLIGQREEESPEEKREKQLKYREELMQQMRSKNKDVAMTTKTKQPIRLFEDRLTRVQPDDINTELISDHTHPREYIRGHTHPREHISDHTHPREHIRDHTHPREHIRDHTHPREHNCDHTHPRDEPNDESSRIRFNNHYPSPITNDYMPVTNDYNKRPYYTQQHPPPNIHPPIGPHPPSHYNHNSHMGPHPPPHYPPPYYYNPYSHYYPYMPHPPDPYNHQEIPNPYMISNYPLRSRSPVGYPVIDGRNEYRNDRGGPNSGGKGSQFRNILDQQVREKKERKEKERQAVNKMYRGIDDEVEIYDPWGKPGGGAPLTDAGGNIVAERGQMRKSYDESLTSPRLSEEEKRKLMQEKTKQELEAQIKQNQERQMKEKYDKQKQEAEDELKMLRDLAKQSIVGRMEIEEEKKKKEKEMEEKAEKKIEPPVKGMTAQEMAEKRFKEELMKKKMKEEEEKQRLDKLAEKMASSNRPSWRQRARSPPIPTLRNQNKPQSPPIPALRNQNKPQSPPIPAIQNTEQSTHSNYHAQNLKQTPTHLDSVHPPTHGQQNLTHNVFDSPHHQHQTPVRYHDNHHHDSTHHQHQTPVRYHDNHHLDSPHHQHQSPVHYHDNHHHDSTHIHHPADVISETRYKSPPTQQRPSTYRKSPDAYHHVTNHETLPRQPSQEVLQGLSNLRSQIKRTMSSSRESQRTKNPTNPVTRHTHFELRQPHPSIVSNASNDHFDSYVSVTDTRPRPSSRSTIATMDIESLAYRNQERAKRLDAILNSNSSTVKRDPRAILDEFLHRNDEISHPHIHN